MRHGRSALSWIAWKVMSVHLRRACFCSMASVNSSDRTTPPRTPVNQQSVGAPVLMEADELAVHIVAVCDPALVSAHTIDLTKSVGG